MRRCLAIIAAMVAAVALAALPVATAHASRTPPGSAYDHRGYEIKASSESQPYCLVGIAPFGPTVTANCNYHDDAQQWIARRDGRWGVLENVAAGQCLVASSRGVSFAPGQTCPNTYGAQWHRTPLGQWQNRGTGTCLTGRNVKGFTQVSMLACMDTYVQKWITTG